MGGAGVSHHAQDRRQVGRTFPHRGRGGLARPFVEAPFIAKPSQAKPSLRLGGGRGFAKAAPYRRANWRRRASPATVSSMLKRLGLNRLSPLEPAEPVRRYERAAPGEIFHIDIKKLGKFSRIGHRVTGDRTDQSNTRGVGWEICASGDRRPSPSRLLGDPTQRKAQPLTAFPVQRPALLSRPPRQG